MQSPQSALASLDVLTPQPPPSKQLETADAASPSTTAPTSSAIPTAAAPHAPAAGAPDAHESQHTQTKKQKKKAERRLAKEAKKHAAADRVAAAAEQRKSNGDAPRATVEYFPPFPADAPALGFAPPHAQLSADVREFLEDVILRAEQDASRAHLVRHMQRGLAQIDAFLQQQHTDARGVPVPDFETLAARDSPHWERHVERARTDKDMRVQDRKLQASLRVALKGMDLKAGRPGRPDDAVYASSEYARTHMPRGNFIAEWRPASPSSPSPLFFPVVRAYRKFTGQEDDGEETGAVGDELLSKFFTQPKHAARDVITTTKENGEAGHLAVLKRSDGQFLFALGSKNTHLLALSLDDVALARAAGGGDAYIAAGPIARALLTMLQRLTPAHRAWLCEFLWQTRMTASFEVLCPGHQHVQLLDYVAEDTPVFYGLSLPALGAATAAVDGAEICVNPVLALETLRTLGVRTVAYEVVPFEPAAYARALAAVKRSHQHEGAVNLFLDVSASVIGLEKFKTVWYVSLRAIREKAKAFCYALFPTHPRKDGSPPTRAALLANSRALIRARFTKIRSFLQVSDAVADAYSDLGCRFVAFLSSEELPEGTSAAQAQRVKHRVADLFPLVWKDFLDRTHASDVVLEREE
ncbi:hypothetical protein PybrP1_002021 [[Pythium] brassicae (nom. inval.)]|nr:hypothetical protein PybrP1_002021 [[Pythium] brassicae (nom. inval.)]